MAKVRTTYEVDAERVCACHVEVEEAERTLTRLGRELAIARMDLTLKRAALYEAITDLRGTVDRQRRAP